MRKNKSLKLNMILNAIKGLLSVLFPLITFPYVSRVLGVDNLGRYNFVNSIISYLLLLAGLGINTYAIREGARIRDDRERIELFGREMLSINILSTVFSYLLLFILLLAVSRLEDDRSLLLIFSLQIIFKTIGVEWVYSIYEDYIYITLRSIVFQVISLILLFLFVKTKDDIDIYALITVLSAVGSNLLNYIHSKSYCDLRPVWQIRWKAHLRPILILFAMSATVTIYVSSDITILGFLCGDYTVGIYSVSVKVYNIVKTILSSVLIVSVPRLSLLLGKNDMVRFSESADDIYKTLLTLVSPAIVGIIVLRKEIVLLFSTSDYISAITSLSLLSIALFFCMGAWFWGQCILIPFKEESTVFKITIFSAVVNIGLNFILVPVWRENAAAITTIVAEGLSFVLCAYVGRKYLQVKKLLVHYIKIAIGCIVIYFIGSFVHSLSLSSASNMMIIIPFSIVFYGVIELFLKNEAIYGIVK